MTYDIPHVELRRLHWGLRHLFLDKSICTFSAEMPYDFDFWLRRLCRQDELNFTTKHFICLIYQCQLS